jgi:hypothetical protein
VIHPFKQRQEEGHGESVPGPCLAGADNVDDQGGAPMQVPIHTRVINNSLPINKNDIICHEPLLLFK